MDIIKGKQKDIILLLKDQFFFLIRMMINKWRIWFLDSLVWVRHCFPVVLPLRRALTAEGDNALSSPHTMAQNAVRCVPSRGPSTLPSPMPSPVISVTLEGGASVHYEMCEVSHREGTNWKNNQYFFSYSLNFLLSPGRETWYRKGSGGTVGRSHSSHTIFVMS